MVKKTVLLLICLILSDFTCNSLLAQQQGKIEYASLGLSFTIPDGWAGQETQNGFLIGSNTEPGFILLTTHEYSTLEQLIAEARTGIVEPNGTSLRMAGDIKQLTDRSIGVLFTGTVEGKQAKSYVIGIINPYGSGVSILATAAADQYMTKLKETAVQIAGSFEFAKADNRPIVEEWKNMLNNARLTYMDSYSSGSDGYSSEEVIDLCEGGYFNYNEKSNLSIDNTESFAYSRGSAKGSGNWAVITNSQNQPVLRLTFYNGDVYEYVLAMEQKKTMLNGKRYFRTYQGEYAPQCF